MIQIEWSKIIGWDWNGFLNEWGLWILFGLLVVIWGISKLRIRKKVKGEVKMDNVKKLEENMIRARMREIQAAINEKRTKEWEEYNAMQTRHREEEKELSDEWQALKTRLEKL